LTQLASVRNIFVTASWTNHCGTVRRQLLSNRT